MQSLAESDVPHLLQWRNRGGTLKISAAPLQGDGTMEILIIHHLVSQHCSPTGWLRNAFWFSHYVLLLTCFTPGKGDDACLPFSFILYFYVYYILCILVSSHFFSFSPFKMCVLLVIIKQTWYMTCSAEVSFVSLFFPTWLWLIELFVCFKCSQGFPHPPTMTL